MVLPRASQTGFRRLRRASLAFTALACAGFAFAAAPARSEEFSQKQRAEIESIVKNYLLQKPEILREAIAELETREKAAEAKARDAVVNDPSGPLYRTENQAVIGNLNGKITLTEFFDYNCGYCKRALGDLAKLMKDNPDLRVILRDLPILSQGSVEAAHVANAASRQFSGDKFWEFHQRLLGARGPVGKAEALAAAKELGADMDRLAKDAGDPSVAASIEESKKLARSLALDGTPGYVIGDELVVGAVGFKDLQAKVVNVRKCGKALC